MPDEPSSRFKELLFRRNSGLAQVALWVLLVALLWGLDLITKFGERAQFGRGLDDFRLVAEQVTSAVAALLMIGAGSRWHRLTEWHRRNLVRFSLLHGVGYLCFTVGHYALFVLMRKISYPWFGYAYASDTFWHNLPTEMLKDVKIYLGMMVIFSLYRSYGFKHRAAAAACETGPAKMLVMTGTGEALLHIADIDYLQACKNYVAIHAHGREHLVRQTFETCLNRLSDHGFVRVHRSYAVNLEKVKSLTGQGRQKQTIVLQSGATVPIGRTFQDEFRQRFVPTT